MGKASGFELLFGLGRNHYLQHTDSSLMVLLARLGVIPFVAVCFGLTWVFVKNLKYITKSYAFFGIYRRQVVVILMFLSVIWIGSLLHYDTALKFGGRHLLVLILSILIANGFQDKSSESE